MKLRHVSVDQFRAEVSEKQEKSGTHLYENKDGENLIVLAPSMPEIRALGGHDSRLVEFIITDETIDRMSDKLSADGWDTKSFEKNPVVLWAHSHYDPPVAKATTLDVLKKQKQVRSVAEFTPRELNALGYMVYQMYVQRYMHAVSVGFFPKEYTWVSSDSDSERARRGGIDFLKQELLEYSAVPVPANPNALAVARSMGIDTAPLKAWAERVLDESTSRNLTDDARQRVEVLRVASSPTGRPLILEIGDMKIASPVKDDSVVKEIVSRRWDCGIKDHVHDTKDDAEVCARFDTLCAEHADLVHKFVATVKKAGVTKAGRVLSKKNEDALKAAADAIYSVLAQVADNGEEEEEDEDKSNSGVNAVVFANEDDDAGEREVGDPEFVIDPARINDAIKDAVQECLTRVTGRLD